MIRVVYHWRVPAANQEAFRRAWRKATTAIRDTTQGARGSLLFESCDDPTALVTIAHWDRLDQWKAFIDTAPADQMKELHDLAKLESSTAFRQLEDQTV